MAYVDGFLLVVPKAKLKAYEKMSKLAGKVWLEYGALEYRECAGDDFSQEMGATFAKRVQLKRNEVVVFSWIVYKSRAQRDKILPKIMKDERLAKICDGKNMPFDMKRMSYGGFKPFVDMSA